MKLTDVWFEHVGQRIIAVLTDGSLHQQQEAIGRAAYEAVRPMVLEEALDLTNYDYDDELQAVVNSWDWKKLFEHPFLPGKIHQMLRDAVCIWASNRLRKLTAKPDPAVEAVAGMLCALDHTDSYKYPEEAAKIVATVDEIRGRACLK